MPAGSTREEDERRVAVGPFARLSAEQVASLDEGRSRGAITNVFKSQRRFQLEAMALALEDPGVDSIGPPDPRGFADPTAWIEAVAAAEHTRGAHPRGGDARGLRSGLGAVGSDRCRTGSGASTIAEPSMSEFRHSAERFERDAIRPALAHFGLETRSPWTPMDLATAMRSMIEGLWLNQCLTREHPTSPGTPSVQGIRDGLRMLWQGATQPVEGAR